MTAPLSEPEIPGHPRYLELDMQMRDDYAQLTISFNLEKIGSSGIIESRGNYDLERERIVQSFVDEVNNICTYWSEQEQYLAWEIKCLKEEKTFEVKDKGFASTDLIRLIELSEMLRKKCAGMKAAIQMALETDWEYLEIVKS